MQSQKIKVNKLNLRPWFRNKGNVFFIHGFSSNILSHLNLAYKFKHSGYRYFSLDLPGHGDTTYNDKHDLNFDNYVNFVKNYIVDNDLSDVILIGHSMGGGIAACVNELIPERIKLLIFEDPLSKTIYKKVFNRLKNVLSKNNVENENGEKKSLKQKISNAWLNSFKNKKEYRSLLINISSPFIISRITKAYGSVGEKNTLLIMGENDNVIQPDVTVSYFKKNIKNLEISIIPNAAHSPSKENFGVYYKTIKSFIKANL